MFGPLAPPAPLRHRIAIALQDPTVFIGVALLALFGLLIAAPLATILRDVVISQTGDSIRTGVEAGEFTTYYLARVFASRMSEILFWAPLANTMAIAACTIAISITLGTLLAWLVARTDLPARRWFSTALIVPFMLPTWTFALAWTTLFKNQTVGGQPGWAQTLGIAVPDGIAYGALPTVIVLSLHYIPFVILLTGNALRRLDAQLEDVARVLGASGPRITWTIVLPLMRPAVLSASLLIFADAIGEFAVPYILGLPVGYETLSTSLYRSISTQQNGIAAVFGAVIVAIGMIALLLDARMTREAQRFALISGKGGQTGRAQPLRGWRWPAFGLAGGFFANGVIIPLTVLALSTVMRIPGRFTAGNFTLDYWIGTDLDTIALPSGILRTAEFWQAGWNSVSIVGTASIIAGVLGMLVGYVVIRSPWRALATALRHITFMPYLVPGIAFAAAFLALFAGPVGPIPALYGTPLILLLALVADQMPFASRSGIAAMTQLGREAEEAGRIAGAGWLRRIGSIVLPIQKGPMVAAVLLPFISGIKGVSLFIILAVPATDVLTTWSLRLIDYNYTQAANAVVLMIALLAWGGTVLINRITGTGLANGVGG
ncbi:ABC transporter permease [Falsirhodobacter deserti]|uniref:ABC transporter permease n=1 Tax=Falsirhodobacter deserti TaxID=1365611 RepID=UPI000FE4430C|nr:iron ABC transporter permease [Falsirhodobacter deserti]